MDLLPDAAADARAAEPEADAAPAQAAKAPAPAKKLKARVLFAGTFGQVDDVVLLDPAAAKTGVAAGELDTDKGAVAYAEGLAAARAKAAA
jgi:hypothetical protein